MLIYLDTCALNRLTDNQSQRRVRAEAEAVENILRLIASRQLKWADSEALHFELSQAPDPVKRAETLGLLIGATVHLQLTPGVERLALRLQGHGLGDFDALHLALCVEAKVDVLITTDDRFTRRAARLSPPVHMQLLNPVDWWARRDIWLRSP